MEIANDQESLATPIASVAMSRKQLAAVGVLYEKIRAIVTHSWKLELMHFVDGQPTVCITVLAPKDDTFCYDDEILKILDADPVPGYYCDGTSHSCEPNGDIRDRDYYLCPIKREASH